jgi:hypothetical protein
MDINKALEIIKALSEGVDPFTGEVFSSDSPYKHPDIIRALSKAVSSLEYLRKKSERQESLPENAGKPWSAEEDNLLIDRFDKGMSFKRLSEGHKRTEGAIRSRLVKLGKISPINTQ